MQQILRDERAPATHAPMRAKQAGKLQHRLAVIGKIIVEKEYGGAPPSEAEDRAIRNRIVDGAHHSFMREACMLGTLGGDDAKIAAEAAAARRFDQMRRWADAALPEDRIVHFVGRDLIRGRPVYRLQYAQAIIRDDGRNGAENSGNNVQMLPPATTIAPSLRKK